MIRCIRKFCKFIFQRLSRVKAVFFDIFLFNNKNLSCNFLTGSYCSRIEKIFQSLVFERLDHEIYRNPEGYICQVTYRLCVRMKRRSLSLLDKINRVWPYWSHLSSNVPALYVDGDWREQIRKGVVQGQAPVPALLEHTGMADEQDGHGDPPLPNSE